MQVARPKAAFYGGKSMLDLTGGLGADDCAFSTRFDRILSLDPDKALNAIFRFNTDRLGIRNVERLDTGAENFLAGNTEIFDLVYADPDRRAAGKRVIADAGSYEPDIFGIMEMYPAITRRWLIKLSPMTDMDWVRQKLSTPCGFYFFSMKGELREMLIETGPDTLPFIKIVDADTGQVYDEDNVKCTGKADWEMFYEPLAATIKAGFHRLLHEKCGLTRETRGGTYLTGNQIPATGLCREFRLEKRISGSLSAIGKQLRELGISKAHVSSREFTNTSEETRKILKLQDGGEYYLFLTGSGKEKTCFVCRKP